MLCDLLGLPESILEPLAALRLQWCEEPSVHGGKPTRPGGGTPRKSPETANGGEASLLDLIEDLHTSALVREPGDRPVDLAEHYKHYLYGHPKDEES